VRDKEKYRNFVGKPHGKRPPGRFRRRWEYKIKVDLRGVGCEVWMWRNLAEDDIQWLSLVLVVLNLLILVPEYIYPYSELQVVFIAVL
jgi:hypothetical protein